jgi:CheY-like chemotaxis protein
VLLVHPDRELAQVIARALERRHSVSVQTSAEGALRALQLGRQVDVVVSAYRLGQGTTARRLFSAVRWRWPRPRLVLYAAETELRADIRAMADAVVAGPGDFIELLSAIEEG